MPQEHLSLMKLEIMPQYAMHMIFSKIGKILFRKFQ